MKRNKCVHTPVNVPQFIHTHAWVAAHVVCLYGWLYVCICMSHMCVYVYVCMYIYITHVHIDTDTNTHNTCEQHTSKETHVYLYHHSYNHTHECSCSHVCMDMCTCVYVCYSMYVYVCIYIAHLQIDETVPYTMHVQNVHAKRYMCTCTKIRTHTRTTGRSCSLVCMDLCTCVHECHKCVFACMYMYITHVHIDTDTHTHSIHIQHTWKKTHVYMYHDHTKTHMSDYSCSLVYMDVYTCKCLDHIAYVCMRVCIYIMHLYVDTDAPYTILVYNVHAKRHMCTYTTIHTHTHMSSHSCSLSVWMCVRVYVCHKCACTCMCVHISISYMNLLKQTRIIHTIHVNNIHPKRHMYKCTMIHTNKLVSGLM